MGRPFAIPEALPIPEQNGDSYSQVVLLMRRLLAEDGCPWDRKQTLDSLGKYVLEEACEVMDALQAEDYPALCEELGDLAFQVVFQTELAQRQGLFGPDDVFRGIISKLVRRHPHVFAEGEASTPLEVEANWEAIKAQEKRNRPLLDNIPRSLPALEGARRMSERVAEVGFDWVDVWGSRAKVSEELAELDEAVAEGDPSDVEHELGDVLFALVNYARHAGVDPEQALRKASLRFRGRFNYVEERVRTVRGDWPRDKGKPTRGVPLQEMDEYWNRAKEIEKNG